MKKLDYYTHFEDARGKLLGLLNEGQWEEINYLETRSGETRGNHYHSHTVEVFFIISGVIDVEIRQPDGVTLNEHLVSGDVLKIEPGEVHTFHCTTDTRWINVLSSRFDPLNPDIHSGLPNDDRSQQKTTLDSPQ